MTSDPGSEGVPLRAAAPSIKLHALDGAEAPPELADDLRRLTHMPAPAVAKLWQVLGPCLADRISKETEQLLDVFATAYGIRDDDLARAIKGCRYLVRAAASRDLPAARLGEDVDRLCPGAPWIKELLAAGYEPLRAARRTAVQRAAIADHGKLLVDAQWRVDTIEASDEGAGLRQPVAVLTLHYREAGEARRITLQALPDVIGKLKRICQQIVP